MAKLNKEFELIKQKVEAAALLLKEANDLAALENTSLSVIDSHDWQFMAPLFNQINNAGWNSSSMTSMC